MGIGSGRGFWNGFGTGLRTEKGREKREGGSWSGSCDFEHGSWCIWAELDDACAECIASGYASDCFEMMDLHLCSIAGAGQLLEIGRRYQIV